MPKKQRNNRPKKFGLAHVSMTDEQIRLVGDHFSFDTDAAVRVGTITGPSHHPWRITKVSDIPPGDKSVPVIAQNPTVRVSYVALDSPLFIAMKHWGDMGLAFDQIVRIQGRTVNPVSGEATGSRERMFTVYRVDCSAFEPNPPPDLEFRCLVPDTLYHMKTFIATGKDRRASTYLLRSGSIGLLMQSPLVSGLRVGGEVGPSANVGTNQLSDKADGSQFSAFTWGVNTARVSDAFTAIFSRGILVKLLLSGTRQRVRALKGHPLAAAMCEIDTTVDAGAVHPILWFGPGVNPPKIPFGRFQGYDGVVVNFDAGFRKMRSTAMALTSPVRATPTLALPMCGVSVVSGHFSPLTRTSVDSSGSRSVVQVDANGIPASYSGSSRRADPPKTLKVFSDMKLVGASKGSNLPFDVTVESSMVGGASSMSLAVFTGLPGMVCGMGYPSFLAPNASSGGKSITVPIGMVICGLDQSLYPSILRRANFIADRYDDHLPVTYVPLFGTPVHGNMSRVPISAVQTPPLCERGAQRTKRLPLSDEGLTAAAQFARVRHVMLEAANRDYKDPSVRACLVSNYVVATVAPLYLSRMFVAADFWANFILGRASGNRPEVASLSRDIDVASFPGDVALSWKGFSSLTSRYLPWIPRIVDTESPRVFSFGMSVSEGSPLAHPDAACILPLVGGVRRIADTWFGIGTVLGSATREDPLMNMFGNPKWCAYMNHRRLAVMLSACPRPVSGVRVSIDLVEETNGEIREVLNAGARLIDGRMTYAAVRTVGGKLEYAPHVSPHDLQYVIEKGGDAGARELLEEYGIPSGSSEFASDSGEQLSGGTMRVVFSQGVFDGLVRRLVPGRWSMVRRATASLRPPVTRAGKGAK